MALKLLETITYIDCGQYGKLFRRQGSCLRFSSIIPFCYRRDIQKQQEWGGHWMGLWPDLVLPQGTQTAQVLEHQPGRARSSGGSSENPAGHLEHQDSGQTPSSSGLQRGSEEGPSTTLQISLEKI